MIDCNLCGHKFESNHKLKRHLNKKIPCNSKTNINIQDYIEQINNKKKHIVVNGIKLYNCIYCNKNLKTISSRSNHQKKCKSKFLEKNNLFTDEQINNISQPSTIINNSQPTSTINNITNNNNNITNNNLINNGILNNGIIINVNGNIDQRVLEQINSFIVDNKLYKSIKSFPNYSLETLVQEDFSKLKQFINKCKKEDLNPSTGHRSDYNLAIELFKEILNVDDYRTKNTFIQEVTDNVAYCFLDDKFYSINLEDLFQIFFQHLHLLLKRIIKIKDCFDGLNRDDKDYVTSNYNQFRDYIDNSDKTELKKELVNCMYKNKQFLTEFINSATPITELSKKIKSKTIQFNSNLVNKLRKKYNLSIKDLDETHEIIKITDKDINYRTTNSIKTIISDNEEIIVDYDNTIIKNTPDGYKLYKTEFMNNILWYDPDAEVGYIEFFNTHYLLTKEELITQVSLINEYKNKIFNNKKIIGIDNS